MNNEVLEQFSGRIKDRVDFAMVTIVEVNGSAPARPGARMLVFANEIAGTIGGGALEKYGIERAREILTENSGHHFERIKTADIGMTCGGAVSMFIEPFFAAPSLWVFGGGHVASAMVPLAASMGFAVTVVDNRAQFAKEENFPRNVQVKHAESYAEVAREVPDGAFAVVVTHGHAHDQQVLLELARREPALPYIGMIGSKRKVPTAFEYLRSAGVEPGANIYAPIGLNLGGNTPSQIALSVVSELLGVLHGKDTLPHMKDAK